jgi:hypothetical protein
MPAVRLVQACAEAAATGDLPTVALLHEVIEARDDGDRKLSRSQRAEVMSYLDRIDYGEREVEVLMMKMQINAIKARLAIGLYPAREVTRMKIALGIGSPRWKSCRRRR